MTDLVDSSLEAGAVDGATVHPLSGHTGAEICGIDLASPLAPGERDVIADALNRWKVVFFRGQQLGHREPIAFARQFGELTYAHPYDDDPPAGFPEVYTVDPGRFAAQCGIEGDAAKRLRRRYSYANNWHTDETAAVNPPAGSVLRAEVVPEYGGGTTYANTAAAYADLSEPVQHFVDGLRAEHRYGLDVAHTGEATAGNAVIARRPLIASGRAGSPDHRGTRVVREPRVHRAHRRTATPGEPAHPRSPLRTHHAP